MAEMWKRTLSFLGLVEEYDDEYDDVPEDDWYDDVDDRRPVREPSREEQSNVRRIAPASTAAAGGGRAATAPMRPHHDESATMQAVRSHTVHVTNPTTFNDVEEVGEKFRDGIPVIMNLAGASESVAKRLLDFASGLIFGLDGRIERVGDRVFLLTPVGTEVSTEERRRLSERGFFNQA